MLSALLVAAAGFRRLTEATSGAAVSTRTTNAGESGLVPPPLEAAARNTWSPSGNGVAVRSRLQAPLPSADVVPMIPLPAWVTETLAPGPAVPVRISRLSEVTPSEEDEPVSSRTARMAGVASAVSTVTAAEAALRLPAMSMAAAVKVCAAAGRAGPAYATVQRPWASAVAVPTAPVPASVTSTALPASAVPRSTSPGSAATVSMTGAAGAVRSTVTAKGLDGGPVGALGVAGGADEGGRPFRQRGGPV